MANFNILVDIESLREIGQCPICLESSLTDVSSCTVCRQIICNKCIGNANFNRTRCPVCKSTNTDIFVSDRGVNSILEKLNGILSKDGRSLNNGGGDSFPLANREHSKNYRNARETFDITKDKAMKLFNIHINANTFYCKFKEAMYNSCMTEVIKRDMAENITRFVDTEGARFSSAAERIERCSHADPAMRITCSTEYFAKSPGDFVRDATRAMVEFSPPVVHLAYAMTMSNYTDTVIATRQHNMVPACQNFVEQFTPLIRDSRSRDQMLLSLDPGPYYTPVDDYVNALNVMQTTFLKFACYLHCIQMSLNNRTHGEENMRCMFNMLETYDCVSADEMELVYLTMREYVASTRFDDETDVEIVSDSTSASAKVRTKRSYGQINEGASTSAGHAKKKKKTIRGLAS